MNKKFSPQQSTSLILGQTEVYECENQNIWSWHKVSDIVEGIELRLSNMAGGFPFEAAGQAWPTSEQIYLAGEFTDTAIQQELLQAKSGYAAKRFIKSKYKKAVREDFPTFRLQWMLWVVWQKCKGNEAFRKLLLSVPEDAILVEDTTTDNQGTAEIWGASNPVQREAKSASREAYTLLLGTRFKSKKEAEAKIEALVIQDTRHIGKFVGQNNIGKILMICRQCLIDGVEPPIDYSLLNQSKITIFGEEISFTE